MNNQPNRPILLITLKDQEFDLSNSNIDVLNLDDAVEHATLQLEHFLKTHEGIESIILSLGEKSNYLLESLVNVIHHNTHKTNIGIHQIGEDISAVTQRMNSKWNTD